MLQYDYVPEPKPVTSDYTIACHYFPGWKQAEKMHRNGFFALDNFPERWPLMGYYDESNPEVTDWEIKWAVEHGINCFIYCWYRKKENMGKPVSVEDLHFAHAIHEGLFHARYQNFMKFAIMWECSFGAPAENLDDLMENLFPFWLEQYFSKENYLKLDGKPVLYVYSQQALIEQLGGEEACREALVALDAKMKECGFPGIHVAAMDAGWETWCNLEFAKRGIDDFSLVEKYKRCGFDSTFQYCWHFNVEMLSPEQRAEYDKTHRAPDERIMEYQLARIRARVAQYPSSVTCTASVMWDRTPWVPVRNPQSLIADFQLSPENFRRLLAELRETIQPLPKDALARRIIMIDNWNEWGEGHYVSPCCEHGFGYLQAIREELTHRDNLPDYRLPNIVGRGPYWKTK